MASNARNYLHNWDDIDKETNDNNKLDEVLQLVRQGIVSQKVYEDLVKTTRQAALGIAKPKFIENENWTEKPLLEGSLFKRVSRKKWRKRYFLLYNNRLEYYKTKKDKKPLGSVEITDTHYASDYTLETGDKLKPHGFMVSNFEHTWYLAAESKELKKYWLHSLQMIIRKLKEFKALEDEPVLISSKRASKQDRRTLRENRESNYRASVRNRANLSVNPANQALAQLVEMERGMKSIHDEDGQSVTSATVAPPRSTNRSRQSKKGSSVSVRKSKSRVSKQKSKGGASRRSKRGASRRSKKKQISHAIPTRVEFDEIEMPNDLTALERTPTPVTSAAAVPPKIRIQYMSKTEAEARLSDARASSRGPEVVIPPKVSKEEEVKPAQEPVQETAKPVASSTDHAGKEPEQPGFLAGLLSAFASPGKDGSEQATIPQTIRDVVGEKLGLLVRSPSYEENLLEEVVEAKQERSKALKTVASKARINEVLNYQDDTLEREEIKAKEEGNVTRAEEIAEERKLAEQYQEELQKEMAEASMQQLSYEEKLRAKERELAQAQAAHEVAAEISLEVAEKIKNDMLRVQQAMDAAEALNRQADEAILAAETAAQRVVDRAEEGRAKLELVEDEKVREEKALSMRVEKLIQEKMDTERKSMNLSKPDPALQAQLTRVTTELEQAESALKAVKNEREMISGEVTRLKQKAKIVRESIAPTVVPPNMEFQSKPKTHLSTKASDLYEQMQKLKEEEKVHLKFEREEAATAQVSFLANWEESNKDDAKVEEDDESVDEFLITGIRKDPAQFDYDDYTESYYSDEEFDFEEIEPEVKNLVPPSNTKEMREKVKSMTPAQVKAAKADFFDVNVELMLTVIKDKKEFDDLGNSIITFGELYQVYFALSDSVMGILIKAKEMGKVWYEGDMLNIDDDSDTVITVL